MIQLKSIVDGFNVILGSWIVHLAAFLTLVFVIQSSPDYEDAIRTQEAKYLFYGLIIFHLTLAIIKYVSLFVNDFFWDKTALLTMIVVALACYLCQNWVYTDKTA